MSHDVRHRVHFDAATVTALAAAVAGLGVSIYLTVEHYNHSITLACPENATVNCLKVTTSRWAVIAGVPVALLGTIYFAAMVLLIARPWHQRLVEPAVIAGGAAGVLMVLYLVYVELFQVDAICLWCTAVHILTVIMFAAVLWQRTTTPAS